MSKVKQTLRVLGRAFVAAVTSPEAVKLERGLGVLVAVRLLQAVGATAGLVEAVRALAG